MAEFFSPTAAIADVYPPLFGLAVPVWSLIWFAMFSSALMAVLVLALRGQDRH